MSFPTSPPPKWRATSGSTQITEILCPDSKVKQVKAIARIGSPGLGRKMAKRCNEAADSRSSSEYLQVSGIVTDTQQGTLGGDESVPTRGRSTATLTRAVSEALRRRRCHIYLSYAAWGSHAPSLLPSDSTPWAFLGHSEGLRHISHTLSKSDFGTKCLLFLF